MNLHDDTDDSKAAAWYIIGRLIPQLDGEPMPSQIDLRGLLLARMSEKLSVWFLQWQKADERWRFLTTDQLCGIASSLPGSEKDIDEVPGIYVFLGLREDVVFKVGQASNLRERICRGHLRYGYQMTESKLIDYCKSRWEWPDALSEQEIAGLMFPMYGSDEQDRRIVEHGLHMLVHPEMP